MLGSLARFAPAVWAFVALAAAPARAELDLTLWSEGESYLRPTIRLDSALRLPPS